MNIQNTTSQKEIFCTSGFNCMGLNGVSGQVKTFESLKNMLPSYMSTPSNLLKG